MGFFSQFKRDNTTSVASERACGRALSFFPAKHESSAEGGTASSGHKTLAAKSFSHATFSKFKDVNGSSPETKDDSSSRAPKRSYVSYTRSSQFSNMVPVYKGSISTVFRAKCVETGIRLVVKVYYISKMTPKQMHKLEREVEIQKAVKDCPHICQLLDSFQEETNKFLILEDCEGGDLFKKMLKEGGSISESKACTDVIVPLLRTLVALDKIHIIHRDIKPENIFLTSSGHIRLGDFGLAIDCSREIPFYRSGTLDYMAPEVLVNPSTRLEERDATMDQLQVRNIVPYTTKVDVWAAGVLAYELVTGHPPFEVDSEEQTVKLILTSENIVMPPSQSAEWAHFVRTALTKKPRKRLTAASLLEHPWIQKNTSRVVHSSTVPLLPKRLIEPFPECQLSTTVADSKVGRDALGVAQMPAADTMVPFAREDSESQSSSVHFSSAQTAADSKGPNSFAASGEESSGRHPESVCAVDKTDTGAAVGMRARLQLYMNRQRLGDSAKGALGMRPASH